MNPRKYNINLTVGASWVLEASYNDSEGALIPLSDFDGQLDIRTRVSDADSVVSLTSDNGGLVFSDTAPNLVVRISRTLTAALPVGNRDPKDWVYSLKIWDTNDPEYSTIVLLNGLVAVNRAVTVVS